MSPFKQLELLLKMFQDQYRWENQYTAYYCPFCRHYEDEPHDKICIVRFVEQATNTKCTHISSGQSEWIENQL